uniref:RNA polymerase II subunit A C-terminal domain phosphatase SSU72 n=1 Tax=Timema cristinae TaxID=61476 RepID=A0A7R9CP42_TIMCR|nr:unnamed protein product [Timema cristinae]
MPSGSGLKVAVICSSNMNRSMEAHAFLRQDDKHSNTHKNEQTQFISGYCSDDVSWLSKKAELPHY